MERIKSIEFHFNSVQHFLLFYFEIFFYCTFCILLTLHGAPERDSLHKSCSFLALRHLLPSHLHCSPFTFLSSFFFFSISFTRHQLRQPPTAPDSFPPQSFLLYGSLGYDYSRQYKYRVMYAIYAKFLTRLAKVQKGAD